MRDDRDDQRAALRSDTAETTPSVVYDWDLGTDRITWGANVGAVLGLDVAHRLPTGLDYADHLAAASPTSRYDAIMIPGGCDTGGGVPYVAIYGLLPARRSSGPITWIEDTGRWFADARDRPGRAHGSVRIVTTRYEAERRRASAGLDATTGALGPVQFHDHVTRQLNGAGPRSAGFAVLIIALGAAHPSSSIDEAAIVATVAHLRADMRGHENVARLGVDRFAVLLEQCDAARAASAGERFIARVAETLDGVAAMRAHVGAVLAPDRARTAEALVRCAEAALAVARRPASPPYVLFDHDSMHATAPEEEGADTIVTALKQGRVTLALQPVVCALTRQTIRHDVRARITRQDGSPLPAQASLPLAAGSGLGAPLDRCILDLVFGLLTRDRSIKLTATVAVGSLSEADLIDHLRASCKRRPDAARRLTVGISERDAIADLDATGRALTAIKALGVTVAIDDVEVASFHALRLLPIDVLTIDGGLAGDDERLRRLIARASDLGAAVVVKEVQDEATANRLADWGVTFLQGDLFGRSEVPDRPFASPIAARG